MNRKQRREILKAETVATTKVRNFCVKHGVTFHQPKLKIFSPYFLFPNGTKVKTQGAMAQSDITLLRAAQRRINIKKRSRK